MKYIGSFVSEPRREEKYVYNVTEVTVDYDCRYN